MIPILIRNYSSLLRLTQNRMFHPSNPTIPPQMIPRLHPLYLWQSCQILFTQRRNRYIYAVQLLGPVPRPVRKRGSTLPAKLPFDVAGGGMVGFYRRSRSECEEGRRDD